MNESNSLIKDCHAHCTNKAIPPRRYSNDSSRPAKSQSYVRTKAENSTSQASLFPRPIWSPPDTKCCPAYMPKSSSVADINRPQMVDPTHLDKGVCSTESIGNSRSSASGNNTPSRRASRAEPLSSTPLGWVGWRALRYQRYLMNVI